MNLPTKEKQIQGHRLVVPKREGVGGRMKWEVGVSRCKQLYIEWTDNKVLLYSIGNYIQQPKCPMINEWIKKRWHIYTMEYYSAIKRNEIRSFVEMCMDLESVIQNEVSQKEKNKYRILTHICGI